MVIQTEIPGQDDMQDTGPDFFRGMHDYRPSPPQPRPRPGLLKRLFASTPRAARRPTPPTTRSSTTPPVKFRARLQHLLTREPVHPDAAPPIVRVDVPCAKGKERNAAADATGNDEDLVPVEYFDTHPPDPNSQQPTAVARVNTGEHGSGRSCFCC
ncbi:hypothetical protein DFH29DRAFT_928491 [Suillus ampliporus]|nr:hypothetical protein DFH29DRAFT_928491 [Suillus ampliporus]